MERPTRAKKNYRPAQVILDNRVQRRTSEQVKADQAKAEAEAAAAKAAAAAHNQSQLDQVRAIEDSMQAEENARSLDDLRPDLYISQKSASSTETLSDSHLVPLDDPIQIPRIPRVPLIDIPQEHSSYRASSHSDDLLTGWQDLEEDAPVIMEENNEDQDYDIQSDNDSEASHMSQGSQQPCPRRKAKFKPQYNVCFFYFISMLS